MPKKLLPFLCAATAALAFCSTACFAGYKGSVSFTEADRARHLQGLRVVMDTASACLGDKLNRHNDFIRRFGVSAYYGDNSSFAKKSVQNPDGTESKMATTSEEKRAMLRQMRVQESLVQQFVPQVQCFKVGDDTVPREIPANARQCQLAMQPTSCIGLTMRCLGDGFAAAGQADLWAQISDFTIRNGVQGDALQVALQQLGWKIVYWNPDLSAAARWDAQEQQAYPGDPKHIWGRHVETEASVLGPRHKYFWATVDDWSTLVNDPDTLQTSPFNPLVTGGGPRGGPYKSGVVAVPPGYL